MNSICSILEEAATEVPDKPLFVFPENRWRSEEILTYSQLASRSGASERPASFSEPTALAADASCGVECR